MRNIGALTVLLLAGPALAGSSSRVSVSASVLPAVAIRVPEALRAEPRATGRLVVWPLSAQAHGARAPGLIVSKRSSGRVLVEGTAGLEPLERPVSVGPRLALLVPDREAVEVLVTVLPDGAPR